MNRQETYAAFWSRFIELANQDGALIALHGKIKSQTVTVHYLDVHHDGKKFRYNIYYTSPRSLGLDEPKGYPAVAIGDIKTFKTKHDALAKSWVRHEYGNLHDMAQSHWAEVIRKMIDAMLTLAASQM